MEGVVSMIQSQEPTLSDSSADQFEVDYGTLKPATLRQLEAYVLSYLRPYSKVKQNRSTGNFMLI